jgi:hypothetical protein
MVYRVDPERVLFRYVDGEAVLINTATSYYYGLNSVGTFVWKLLAEKSRTNQDLLDAIEREYHPPMDAAARDLDNLLAEFKNEGLIVAEES